MSSRSSRQKTTVPSRAARARVSARLVRQLAASSCVVLDQVGFIDTRRGGGVLRLKLIGPVAELRRLRLQVGARLALGRQHINVDLERAERD